jgi:UDP-N-acetyl-D-glucosamine dehydrogenase
MSSNIYQDLKDKIQSKSARIAIIGLGYVGLPLAVEFSKKFQVIGFDVSSDAVAKLKSGKSYIIDIPDSEIKKMLKQKFKPTSDPKRIKDADFIIICVPTPLEEDKTPDLSYIKSAAATISKVLKKGQFVILESTTFPGTTEDYLRFWLEEDSGLSSGLDFGLAFSPERVDPGNKKYQINNTPKVVGGLTDDDTDIAAQLYDQIVEVGVVPVKNCRTAEAVKLMENIFRHVNIALVNEMALVMEKMDIDIREIINAASTKPFGYMTFYPGPGVGGHCIPLDPFYLSFAARQKGIMPRFIELSGEINEYMKVHVVSLVEMELKNQGNQLRNSKIGILGLSYKKDINDTRESPAINIIEDLVERGAKVRVYDPYVNKVKTKVGDFSSVKTPEELFDKVHAIIIVTDHTVFKKLKYNEFSNKMQKKIIIDTRGIIGNRLNKNIKIIKI